MSATAQEVGAACAANVLAVAVPCHRVVKADGSISGYRWGVQAQAPVDQYGEGGVSRGRDDRAGSDGRPAGALADLDAQGWAGRQNC